ELHGASYGGSGGVPRELRVQPGQVVVGLQTRSAGFVDAIRLQQAKWDGASLAFANTSWTPWVGGPGGMERPERVVEPFGSGVAIGIAGRASTYVDNLTLIGAELVRLPGSVVTTTAGSRRSSAVASG